MIYGALLARMSDTLEHSFALFNGAWWASAASNPEEYF
jgi:hypothetical protein